MKKFIILIIVSSNILFSQTTPSGYGGPYDEVVCNPEPININAGDVVSADVLNEILTRINNLQTGGINSEQDLIGEWSCTSTCRYGACNDNQVFNGYWKNSFGIYIVSQTIDITSEGSDKVRLKYPHNLGQSFLETGDQDCLARVRNGKIFITNGKNDSSNYEDTCYNTGTYSIEMKANQCFTMENINDSVTSCKKNNIPPAAPINLKVSFSDGEASLSWQKGDDRQSGYVLKRKQTVDGAYEDLVSLSLDSYSDNSISSGNTYWYRVFAKNEYGEGIGSNVVTITYSQ